MWNGMLSIFGPSGTILKIGQISTFFVAIIDHPNLCFDIIPSSQQDAIPVALLSRDVPSRRDGMLIQLLFNRVEKISLLVFDAKFL